MKYSTLENVTGYINGPFSMIPGIKHLILIVILLTVPVVGCHSLSKQNKPVTFWAMGQEGKHLEKLLTKFTRLHPEIPVKIQRIPWSSAHEKLLTAFAGQSTPDICQLGNTWIAEFESMGALTQLDSFVFGSPVIHSSNFFSGIWQTNVIHKKLYGIPWYVDTRVLFYRKDLLAKVGYRNPPKTWREWAEVSKRIKRISQPNKDGFANYFPLAHNNPHVPLILVMENRGRFLKKNKCYGAFEDPNTVNALQFYVDFFKKGLAPKNMNRVSNIYQGFQTGFFSMFISGPWDINEIRKRVPSLRNKWGTAPMPKGKKSVSVAGGASLVIFKSSKRKSEAWKVIEFLSRPKTQTEFFKLTRDLPAVREAWSDSTIRFDPQIRAFREQLETVQSTPKLAEWEQIASKMQEYLEKVIYDRMTLEQAVIDLDRDVDRILEKRRWLLSQNLLPE